MTLPQDRVVFGREEIKTLLTELMIERDNDSLNDELNPPGNDDITHYFVGYANALLDVARRFGMAWYHVQDKDILQDLPGALNAGKKD